MGSNRAEFRVGRLLEVCIDSGYPTPDDVDEMFDAIANTVGSQDLQGAPYVTIADWRRCPMMSPGTSERLAKRLAVTNDHVLRSAALASADSPAAVLQFLRLIREAGLPTRKLFFDAKELATWLKEVLTPEEADRLDQFLVERTGSARTWR